MHLHRLTFAGLGPFKDEQTIDFGHLAESPLFLLEGPTGSGKSTIIDALVFALYGSVASTDGDDARLVSHYLETGVSPFVDLVFETTAGVFRVLRTPKFERAKQRGTGMTDVNATAKLWRLSSPDAEAEGEPLATLPRDVNPEIERAIGLNRRQFIGTVILPQGEFAAFLKAHVNERQAILQRIFRTEQYETLQRRLRAAKNDAERAMRQADEDVRHAAGRFAQAAGLDADWQAPTDPDERAAATDAVLTSLQTTATNCLVAQQALEENERQARALLDGLTRRKDRRDRKAAALDRLEKLSDDAHGQVEREAALDADARAARVTGVLEGMAASGKRLGSARAEEERRRQSAPADARDLPIPALEQAVNAALREVTSLEPLVEMEAGLPARASSLDADRARLVALAREISHLEAALAALPRQIEALEAQREAARGVASGLDMARQRVQSLTAQLRAARELHEALKEQSERSSLLAQAAADAAAASAERDRLQRAHYAGMAAELATELAPGDPCPVCGSIEHPTPATPGADHVSKDQVEEAEGRHSNADAIVVEAREAKHAVDTRVETLRTKAGDTSADALEADLQAANAAVVQGEQATSDVQLLTDEIDGLTRQRDTHVNAKASLVVEQATLTTTVESEQVRLEADQQAVTEARGPHPTVGARRLSVEDRRGALDTLIEAMRSMVAADEAHQQRRHELDDALATEGFEDAAAATAALLAPDERTRVKAAIRVYQDEEAAVQGILGEPDLVDVDEHEQIDTAPAHEALESVTAQLKDAIQKAGDARLTHEQSTLRAGDLHAEARRRDELVATSAPVILLGKIVQGEQSRLSMTLASYVLQQRFRAVVAAANDHLQRMSDGALMLESHGEAADGRQLAGLGLRVIDLRAGDKPRGTGTLSGGETFYTALSLALGLASVVTGEAGGVRLGTLFVDEGFGSLDPEVLDDVLGVLTGLHEHGRVVGVVSHVEELKARIPDRIEVRRSQQNGPSTLVLTA